MPLYEFRCKSCNHEFEELVLRIGALAPCPACRSADVARLMSTFSARSSDGAGGYAPVSSGSGCNGCVSSSCSGCSH